MWFVGDPKNARTRCYASVRGVGCERNERIFDDGSLSVLQANCCELIHASTTQLVNGGGKAHQRAPKRFLSRFDDRARVITLRPFHPPPPFPFFHLSTFARIRFTRRTYTVYLNNKKSESFQKCTDLQKKKKKKRHWRSKGWDEFKEKEWRVI